MLIKKLLLLFCAISMASVVNAGGSEVAEKLSASSSFKSHYVGQEIRQIKSLSKNDIKQLKAGKGWGLAKAAELNGMPGPAHILEMKVEISLTSEQELNVQSLFREMKSKAIPLGEKLITLEKSLNDEFAKRSMTKNLLRQQLTSISEVKKELRFVHLDTHLSANKILTTAQIEKYNKLRGYTSGDPCKNIPTGHDSALWKKHNNCQ